MDNKIYPDFKDSLILLALLLVLQILMGSLYNILLLLDEFIPVFMSNEVVEYIILFYLGPVLTMGITIKYALNKSQFNFYDIFGKWINSGLVYLGTTFLLIGLSIIMSEIDNFIVTFLPDEYLMEEIFIQLLDHNIIMVLISVGILAPVLEEILFRGIMLKGLLKNYPPRKAIILSSLIFAVAHFNIRQGILTFFMGIFLGWLFYKSHSLWLPIYGHFVNNSMAVIGFHFFEIPGYTDYTPTPYQFQPVWLTITGILLIIIGYYLFIKQLKMIK